MINDDDRERWQMCFHEAGHAIVGVANGLSIRYISMKPRSAKASAHVVWESSWAAFYRGQWEAIAASTAAGILAEWIHIGQANWLDVEFDADAYKWWTVDICKWLTRYAGRDDLKQVRGRCQSAWARSRESALWSKTPITPDALPVDLAVQAWRHAVWTLAVRWYAVEELAGVLYDSTRAVTSRQVREILDRHEPNLVAIESVPEHLLKPWFLEHSRLKWTPSERWFADVERYAVMRRQHESELAGVKLICKDCGCQL